ncbi:MAG TPA: hypothetical protein EYG68_06460 [Leucothrix mucor]|nr:hypothetical protein [Leucothrix mucor]
MEMFTLPLSVIAFAVTLWITSFFARLLNAKKANMAWIAVSWLIGIILSVVAVIGVNILALEQYLEVAATYFLPLVIFTLVYKVINQMDWMAALTTNIVAIAVGIIAVVLTIVSLGKPLETTIVNLASKAGFLDKNIAEKSDTLMAEVDVEEDEIEPVFKDADLLNPRVIKALAIQKNQKEKGYKEPKFHLISVRYASGAIGYKVRLSQNNGKIVEGSLSKIQGGQLVVKQNLYGGIATTPIAISSVKKLEVYR